MWNLQQVDLTRIINESDYTKQVFNVDETVLYQKKISSRTFIVREVNAWLQVSNNRLTFLLGAKATGDFRWKPLLIYHFENPKALRNYAQSTLPVLCKWNNKAQRATHILQHDGLNILSPLLRPSAQKQRSLSEQNCSQTTHPRALMEM